MSSPKLVTQIFSLDTNPTITGVAITFISHLSPTSSFTVPPGVTAITITGCGGGGGGGSGGNLNSGDVNYCCGGGGGGGSVTSTIIRNVTPGNTLNFTIGTGGPGGNAVTGTGVSGNFGTSGGDTTITINSNTIVFRGAEHGWGGIGDVVAGAFTLGGFSDKDMNSQGRTFIIVDGGDYNVNVLGMYGDPGRGGLGNSGTSDATYGCPFGLGTGGGAGGSVIGHVGAGGGGGVSNNIMSSGGNGGTLSGGFTGVAGTQGYFGGGAGGGSGGIDIGGFFSGAGGAGGAGFIQISWVE